MNRNDINGQWVETALDIASFAYSLNEFRQHKSWSNAAWLAFDGFAVLVPILPGSGVFRGTVHSIKYAKSMRVAVELHQAHHYWVDTKTGLKLWRKHIEIRVWLKGIRNSGRKWIFPYGQRYIRR